MSVAVSGCSEYHVSEHSDCSNDEYSVAGEAGFLSPRRFGSGTTVPWFSTLTEECPRLGLECVPVCHMCVLLW